MHEIFGRCIGFITQSIPWAVRLTGSAGLKMTIHDPLFPRAILTRKVAQTHLVFGVWSGIISKYVHAKLHVSMYSGYDLCHPGWPKTGFLPFDPCDLKKLGQTRRECVSCQVHLRCKFRDPMWVTCRDNTHTSIFYDDLKPGKIGHSDLSCAITVR